MRSLILPCLLAATAACPPGESQLAPVGVRTVAVADAAVACCDDVTCAETQDAGACACKACDADPGCLSRVCRALPLPFTGYCLSPRIQTPCSRTTELARVDVQVTTSCVRAGSLCECARRHHVELSSGSVVARLVVTKQANGEVIDDREVGAVLASTIIVQRWQDAVDAGLWCESSIAPAADPCMTNQPGVEVHGVDASDGGILVSWGMGGAQRPGVGLLRAVDAATSPFAAAWAAEGLGWTSP